MLEEFFLSNQEDKPEELEPKNVAKDNRPFCTVDTGVPYGIVKFVHFPKGFEGDNLTFNGYVGLMRDYKKVDIQFGRDWVFLSWKEAKGLFGSLVNRYLQEKAGIYAGDPENEESVV